MTYSDFLSFFSISVTILFSSSIILGLVRPVDFEKNIARLVKQQIEINKESIGFKSEVVKAFNDSDCIDEKKPAIQQKIANYIKSLEERDREIQNFINNFQSEFSTSFFVSLKKRYSEAAVLIVLFSSIFVLSNFNTIFIDYSYFSNLNISPKNKLIIFQAITFIFSCRFFLKLFKDLPVNKDYKYYVVLTKYILCCSFITLFFPSLIGFTLLFFLLFANHAFSELLSARTESSIKNARTEKKHILDKISDFNDLLKR